MGNRLVVWALLPMSDLELSDRARLVLVRMCATARDSDETPTYFGGWEYLANALGYGDFTDAAHKAVTRAVRDLLDAKLISVQSAGAPGKRAIYRVHPQRMPPL